MSRYCAHIVPTSASVLCKADVIFEADDMDTAEGQAWTYADRIDPYAKLSVDSVHEIGGV